MTDANNSSDSSPKEPIVSEQVQVTKSIQQQIAEELYVGKYKFYNGILYQKIDNYYEEVQDELEVSRITHHISKFKFKRDEKGNITHPYATAETSKKCLEYAKQFVTTSVAINDSCLYCTNGVLVEHIEGDKVPYTLSYRLRDYSEDDFCIGKPTVTYDPKFDNLYLNQLFKCLDKDQLDMFMSILALSPFGGALQAKKLIGRLTRAVIVKGRGNNGKDAFKMPMILILGGDRVSSIKTQAIADYDSGTNRFGLSPLINSRLNWASENPKWVDITDLVALKEMVTSDPLTIEEKHKKPKRIQTNCINVFSVNQTPRLDTAEESIKSRFCVVSFNKTFTTNSNEVNESKGILKADPRFQDEQFLIDNVCSAFLNALLLYRQKVYAQGHIDWTPTDKAIEDIQCEYLHLREFCRLYNFGYGEGTTPIISLYKKLEEFYIESGCLEFIQTGKDGKGKPKAQWQDSPNKNDPYIKGTNQVFARFKALFPETEKEHLGNNKFGLKGLIFKGQQVSATDATQFPPGAKVRIYPNPDNKSIEFSGTIERRLANGEYIVSTLIKGQEQPLPYREENLELISLF